MQKEILIVDDHVVVSSGVSIILGQKFKGFNIYTTENYNQTLKTLKSKKIDLIILDINIPGGKNTDMIHELKSIQPDIKILIFSVYNEETHACPYIVAGANGYLNKLSTKKEITKAVDTILKTGSYLTPTILQSLIDNSTNKESANPLDKLSMRQKEITELLIQGDGNIEIANKLSIQLTTVSTHKNKIFNKLKIKNIVELISLLNKPPGLNF
ncbi:response regulator [Flavobacterium algicola]|uniref:response regulator n=1 Tax=Flavobacterium algicola TaxID=556529 RepID=UPI001EFCEBBB|nr:response regulator transcription factor [Flavobacterium algicola]MCG9794059.1 response regulator transcription factor [Flavobacterium algicola]